MRIEDFLERNAATSPNKAALVCGDREWTYGELDTAARKLACYLLKYGVEKQDRIAICLDNSQETVLSIFATFKINCIFVPLSPGMKLKKLVHLLNHCRAVVLVTDEARLKMLRDRLPEMPHLKAVLIPSCDRQRASQESVQVASFCDVLEGEPEKAGAPAWRKGIDLDPAAVIYTSGTTGQPKGVILTHLNIVSSTTCIAGYLKSTSSDIILNVLPLSHSYGLMQLMAAFYSGATLILERSFGSPYQIVETIKRKKVSGFAVVPSIASSLLELEQRRDAFPTLRYLTNAAAALPSATIGKLRKRFPHVEIFSMYGLTECIRASYLPPDQIEVRPTSIGRGLPNQEMYIVDENGRRLGPGMTGELVVRGSNVMKGYWELPEETDKVLRPGPLPGERVLHTGDLFRMDDEGYFYFVSRKDDMIKTSGQKVSPREVEEVLCSLDAVAEAAVVGIPDEILGQAVKAVIRLNKGAQLSRAEIVRYCAQHLEDFMVPTVVEFRDTLPKTPNQKIRKSELIQPQAEYMRDRTCALEEDSKED